MNLHAEMKKDAFQPCMMLLASDFHHRNFCLRRISLAEMTSYSKLPTPRYDWDMTPYGDVKEEITVIVQNH